MGIEAMYETCTDFHTRPDLPKTKAEPNDSEWYVSADKVEFRRECRLDTVLNCTKYAKPYLELPKPTVLQSPNTLNLKLLSIHKTIVKRSKWEIPKIRGTLFGGLYSKDPTI